jgi:glutathionylspermidine synthase
MHASVDAILSRGGSTSGSEELRAGVPVRPEVFEGIRRRMMLEFCKWDSQIGDRTTLAPFPLLIQLSAWQRLAQLAESATAELLAAERELLYRPDLHRDLGLPRAIRRAMRGDSPPSQAAARVMRFDFHPTTNGWRVSEVNSDVPGGFTESSSFTALMAEHFAASPAGCPVAMWADAIAQAGRTAALIYAPGYLEDMQIMAYLSDRLAERGVSSHLATPQQLRFVNAQAYLECTAYRGPIDIIVRFFQAEWLGSAGDRRNWEPLFVGGHTPVTNPATAVLTESKRFPLVMDRLRTQMATWRALLPETRDPRDAPWKSDDRWIVKTALCNTGDTVCMRDQLPPRKWRQIRREIFWCPGAWVAQKRFDASPVDSPVGRIYPCIGVYTIDGKAAGIYGRFSSRPLIDFAAVDVAVLVEDGS